MSFGACIGAQGVLLNMALINYAMSFLIRRGYTPVQTPFFMRKVRPHEPMLHPRGCMPHSYRHAAGVHERVRSAGGL